jgi:hypothetical protein
MYNGDSNYYSATGSAASLAVKNVPHYVDTNNQVHDTDTGTHSNFASMRAGPDGVYNTLTETTTVMSQTTMGTTTNTGTSYSTIAANTAYGQVYTAPTSSTTVASINFFGRSSSGTINVIAIITDAGGNILPNGISSPVATSTTAQAYVATFATPPSITPGLNYMIMIISQTSSFRLYYTATTGGNSSIDSSNSYATPTNPSDSTFGTINYRAFYANVNRANNQMDLETQFSSLVNPTTYTQLLIQTGVFSSPAEIINVDYWNGAGWTNLGTLTANSLNTFNISPSSATFEIRFTDGIQSNDQIQSWWRIDSAYIW